MKLPLMGGRIEVSAQACRITLHFYGKWCAAAIEISRRNFEAHLLLKLSTLVLQGRSNWVSLADCLDHHSRLLSRIPRHALFRSCSVLRENHFPRAGLAPLSQQATVFQVNLGVEFASVARVTFLHISILLPPRSLVWRSSQLEYPRGVSPPPGVHLSHFI